MLIRNIQANELSELVKIDHKANLTPWSQLNYEESFVDCNHTLLGIFLNDTTIIGVCVYSQILDEAEILQFVIAKEYQRQGYAKILLEEVSKQLFSTHIKQIFLEVCINNHPAIALYDKLGFNQAGLRKNYYKIGTQRYDALIMGKSKCL